jgi:hypothetical protein
MDDYDPYLYFHHLTGKLTLCFYKQESDGSGCYYTKKQPCEYEISETEAMEKYPAQYMEALDALQKRERLKTQNNDIKLPKKEGIEEVIQPETQQA